MAELQHVGHSCPLSSPEIVADGICNICFEDKPVELACDLCNFDLCKTCSNLPPKVSHDFHSEHPLELRIRQNDQKPEHIICYGCGNMSSGCFYECKECEIYLDLGCALMENISEGWDVKELLHDNHAHLVKRCRPGLDARGSCLLCELPLSPSAISYGCVHCYLFFHEHCLYEIPTEIQHPVHPQHPLKRYGYIKFCRGGRSCNACGGDIDGVPFGCLKCNFELHLRCADTLLRGMVHPSHEHRLFYANNLDTYRLGKSSSCQICKEYTGRQFFYCIECHYKFHLKCLEIPKSLVDKSYHIHPLVCKVFDDDSLEYCGVCEMIVYSGHHVYSCEICDFLGHMECILRKGAATSPLYLKDLYFSGQDITRPTDQDNCKAINLGNKLMVNNVGHTHVLSVVDLSELDKRADCHMCKGNIYDDNACKCDTCSFQTHRLCAELGLPQRYPFHPNHRLTLLPGSPVTGVSINCDICKHTIYGFNLFCRICSFVIDVSCVLKDKRFLETLHRGQKLMVKTENGYCLKNHRLFEVTVSSSYPITCTICEERLCGKIVSCVDCREVFHPWCIRAVPCGIKVRDHPLHPCHKIRFFAVSGSKCIVCKLNITKYGYSCRYCQVISFHFKCVKAVGQSEKTKYHSHYLYNFWEENSTRVCSVCSRRCGASFYGCIGCGFSAHVECVGFPTNVKNHRHQHTVVLSYSSNKKSCSLCGSECQDRIYSCGHCEKVFHMQCIMSTVVGRQCATKEDQLQDVYLMYIEQDLLKIYPKW